MQRCTKCTLPESYPWIEFDSNGTCNLCRNFQAYRYRGEDALQEIVSAFDPGGGNYDCIVPLSGGRDSSYVLAYVVDELKMRPLALSVDNGFMPDETRQNIANTVRILGVDHIYVSQRATMGTFTQTLRAWKHRPDPAMIAFLCNGCHGSIKGAIMKAARENDVHLIIGGGGEIAGSGGEPEKSFAEPLIRLRTNALSPRLSLVMGAVTRLLSNPRYLASPSVILSFLQEGYFRFWRTYPEALTVIGLFEFLEWNEDHIVSTIQSRLGWIGAKCWNTTWRADCKVHWLKEYLYKETLGFTKNDELLSGMVREGMISREEALARLRRTNELPEEFLAAFVGEHGIEFTQLREACSRWRKNQETQQ
jgi:hypothetical protein